MDNIKEKYKKQTGLDLDIEIGSLGVKYYNENYVEWLERQIIVLNAVVDYYKEQTFQL